MKLNSTSISKVAVPEVNGIKYEYINNLKKKPGKGGIPAKFKKNNNITIFKYKLLFERVINDAIV